jgi:hypothetical protein
MVLNVDAVTLSTARMIERAPSKDRPETVRRDSTASAPSSCTQSWNLGTVLIGSLPE